MISEDIGLVWKPVFAWLATQHPLAEGSLDLVDSGGEQTRISVEKRRESPTVGAQLRVPRVASVAVGCLAGLVSPPANLKMR
jgi:hypothetical protein